MYDDHGDFEGMSFGWSKPELRVTYRDPSEFKEDVVEPVKVVETPIVNTPTDPPKKSDDKATTHKDKIKNYKTDLEDYNKKEAKAFEEYDKGYNQREDDWKNNYNSYKEKLNKDWGEARNVPDWKIGLNNADGRGVDYLINQGFDIDDITWNDLPTLGATKYYKRRRRI
jgi:hypothetical protein